MYRAIGGYMKDIKLMRLSTQFIDGIMWTWMDNTYSWLDGEYSHRITLAMTIQNIEDLIDAWADAIYLHTWFMEVKPQIYKEIGDISFAEIIGYKGEQI